MLIALLLQKTGAVQMESAVIAASIDVINLLAFIIKFPLKNILLIPSVEFSDGFTNLLKLMLGADSSASVEV